MSLLHQCTLHRHTIRVATRRPHHERVYQDSDDVYRRWSGCVPLFVLLLYRKWFSLNIFHSISALVELQMYLRRMRCSDDRSSLMIVEHIHTHPLASRTHTVDECLRGKFQKYIKRRVISWASLNSNAGETFVVVDRGADAQAHTHAAFPQPE